MSLNWNTKDVKYFSDNPEHLWVKYNPGTKEEYEDVNAETKSLIFGTMAVGLGGISHKNMSDFYARFKILEKYENHYVYGKFVDGNVVEVFIDVDMLVKHAGLSTNVSDVAKKDWIDRFVASASCADDKVQFKKDVAKDYNSFVQDCNTAISELLYQSISK